MDEFAAAHGTQKALLADGAPAWDDENAPPPCSNGVCTVSWKPQRPHAA